MNISVSILTYAERASQCQNPLAKKLLSLMQNKQTNLSFSADVTSAQQLLDLADQLGPDICVLKTHIDIIEDFTPTLTHKLQTLAERHQFLLFEDRKFADIGHTVKHQYGGGIYRIAQWADMINAHSLPGPGVVAGLAEVKSPKPTGLLLIAELSSAQHLLDAEYQAKTLQMAQTNSHFVIGFIAQKKLDDDPRWIYLTPGVQLGSSKDGLGQQYVTPEKAIYENDSDIIIVGRGIIGAKDLLGTARIYREEGWKAYQKKFHF